MIYYLPEGAYAKVKLLGAGEDQIQCGVVITTDQTDLPMRRAWIEPDGTLVLITGRGTDCDTNPNT